MTDPTGAPEVAGRVPSVVLPRWVLERAREDFVHQAMLTGCKVDQTAADAIARVLGASDDAAFVLTINSRRAAPADKLG